MTLVTHYEDLKYGVICEECGDAVEYADITRHSCSDIIRRKALLRGAEAIVPDPSWQYRLPKRFQAGTSQLIRERSGS